jgi:nicotinate-nucleotide pyrophosphorylase (carboxylating)
MDKDVEAIIERALEEDLPHGDITSESIIPSKSQSQAVILSKENGILAGIAVAENVFSKIDPLLSFVVRKKDGQEIKNGDVLAELRGSSISLLKGERTALNFLQRLSGIATITHQFVEVLEGCPTKILDTRKTTPGLRVLEKYAVKMGGGNNHRRSLSDMVLIKDNHIRLVKGILEAVQLARAKVHEDIKIEVETTCKEEVIEAVMSGADMIMLDNMSLDEMRDIVALVKGKVPLEISGNVDLKAAKKYANLGVDYISVGSLTHSFKSLDISMDIIG